MKAVCGLYPFFSDNATALSPCRTLCTVPALPQADSWWHIPIKNDKRKTEKTL
jgi:hypothetical protein